MGEKSNKIIRQIEWRIIFEISLIRAQVSAPLHESAHIIFLQGKSVFLPLVDSWQFLARLKMEQHYHRLHAIYELENRAVANIRNCLEV